MVKDKYNKTKPRYRKASGGYQKLPEPTIPSGGDIASQAMSSAAAGASAGAAFGPYGAAIGGAVGGITGAVSGFAGKKSAENRLSAVRDKNKAIDKTIEQQDSAIKDQQEINYIAEDGVQGPVDNSAVEFELGEIHGTPKYRRDGQLIGFEIKNIAPDVSHEEANENNPDNLIPTREGLNTGTARPDITDKPAMEDGDTILPTQDKDYYNEVMGLIERANKGDFQAGSELNKIINSLPTDESNDKEDMGKKKYSNGVAKYASVANTLMQSSKDIEGVNRRNMKSKAQKYVRDTEKEERDILESRNAAASRMRGKAMSAGQANAYSSNLQRNADKAKEDVNARERAAQRAIEAQNINRENQDQATNLQLENQYDDIERRQRAGKDAYRDTGFKGISEHAMVNERQKYQESLDQKKMDREDEILEQGMLNSTNYIYNNKTGKVEYKKNRDGVRSKRKYK